MIGHEAAQGLNGEVGAGEVLVNHLEVVLRKSHKEAEWAALVRTGFGQNDVGGARGDGPPKLGLEIDPSRSTKLGHAHEHERLEQGDHIEG